MARKPRVQFAGALYHVICRGNQRQTIFRTDADRKYYLERLEQYRQRYGFKVYAYVLMSNHVHMLIEAGRVPLSRIMQGVQLRYTSYFNKKYKKVGHLFQGRYKAILCDRDAYLLELVRYLHLNPQRMRCPMQAATYRWSSHGAYLGKDNPVKIEIAPVLGEFAKSVGKARLAYLRFMAEGKANGHQPDYYDVRDQRFLGDERFVEEIEMRVDRDRDIAMPIPRAKLTALLPLVAKVGHSIPQKCYNSLPILLSFGLWKAVSPRNLRGVLVEFGVVVPIDQRECLSFGLLGLNRIGQQHGRAKRPVFTQ